MKGAIRRQAGMTLIELVVAIFIVCLLISAIFILVKSYGKSTNQVVADVDTDLYTNNLLQIISEELSASGHQPIDSVLTSITANGKVLDIASNTAGQVEQINIVFDLNQNTREYLTYKLIPLSRSIAHPNEKALVKTKQLSDGVTTETVFIDEIAMANIDSFSCVPSINASAINPNAAVKGVDCTLSVYSSKDYNGLKNYKIYTNAENQI